MGKRMAKAVLHCSQDQRTLVIKRGIKVRDSLYVNVQLYTTPKITLNNFEGQLKKALTAEAAAMNGSVDETAEYYKQAGLLFNMLVELVFYVNGLYRGKKVELLASGFDVVDETVPQDIPSTPVVNRLVAGKEAHSVKFYLARSQATPGKKKRGITYIVEMTTDASKEENFKPVLIISDQNKLVIKDLTRGVEIFFRLAAINSKGQSDWTEIFPIFPQ